MASLGTLGTATPLNADDTTYHTFTDDTTEAATYALDNVPADFGSMNSDMEFTTVASLTVTPDTDTYNLHVAIINGTTVLAGASSTYDGTNFTHAQNSAQITTTGDQTDGPTTFTYVNQTADKATWDAASVQIVQVYVQDKGKDGSAIQADYVYFGGTYDANYSLTLESTTADQANTNVTLLHNKVIVPEAKSPAFDQANTDVTLTRSVPNRVLAIDPKTPAFDQANTDVATLHNKILVADPKTTPFDQANTDVTTLHNKQITLESTTADQANTDVTLDRTYHIVIESKSPAFDQANTDVNLRKGFKIVIESTTADQANTDVTFDRTFQLVVDSATPNQVETDVSTLHNKTLVAEPKATAFDQANTDVTPLAGRRISIESGTFNQVETDVNFPKTYQIVVDSATPNQVETDAQTLAGRYLNPEAKATPYDLAGNNVGFPKGFYINLNAKATPYDLAGTDLSLRYFSFTLDPGTFTFNGANVDFKPARMTAEPQAFTFSGTDVLLEQKPITEAIWFRVPDNYNTIWINL